MSDSDLVVKTLKKEKAALTVEASLILTLFMFFVLFLLSFNRVYSAQNTVSHATLQAADAISSESMLRAGATEENIEKLLAVSNHIYAGESIPKSALEKLTNANIVEVARNNFISAIAESESKADSVLKKYGVKDGINGIARAGRCRPPPGRGCHTRWTPPPLPCTARHRADCAGRRHPPE